jgi:hypothetical protein
MPNFRFPERETRRGALSLPWLGWLYLLSESQNTRSNNGRGLPGILPSLICSYLRYFKELIIEYLGNIRKAEKRGKCHPESCYPEITHIISNDCFTFHQQIFHSFSVGQRKDCLDL